MKVLLLSLVLLSSLALSQTTKKPAQSQCSKNLNTSIETVNSMAAELAALRAENDRLKEENNLLRGQNDSLVSVNAEQVDKKNEAVKAVVVEYQKLRADYDAHLKSDIELASQLKAALAAPPAQQRGYWSSVLQSMSDGARNAANKPSIHCNAVTWGNQTTMDCN